MAGLSVVLLVMFFVYGWINDRDPVKALGNIVSPYPEPVETNPALLDVSDHRISWLGDIKNHDLAESSGLAASSIHDQVLWSINDSGGEAELFALNTDGSHLARFTVNMGPPSDWEAMDTFRLNGRSYIAVGDIGDNLGWRDFVEIIIVAEPEVLGETDDVDSIEVAWRIRFTYPDGARDSEALSVDVPGNRVLILSKRDYPQELFSIPLLVAEPDRKRAIKAHSLGLLKHLPQPTQADFYENPDGAQWRHMPTGMDLDVATNRLLITTYQHAYLYDLSDLSQAPTRVPMPSVGQREAIAWAYGRGDRAYFSRERKEKVGIADIFLIEFQTPP